MNHWHEGKNTGGDRRDPEHLEKKIMSKEKLDALRESLALKATGFAESFMQRLCSNASADDFLDWMLRYDAFNRGFPGAAAELAGRITTMMDFFGDIESETIASRVMAAITDEFLDRSTGDIALHSKLRRELVLFGLENLSGKSRSDAIKIVKTYNPLRNEVLAATRRGYGLENQNDFRGVFSGLGFFTASETSGSSEFVTLNKYVDTNWPGLKTAMQSRSDDQGRALYAWIADHEDLEADHAGFAFSSIELAMQYLPSNADKDSAFLQVELGINQFFAMANRTLLADKSA